MATISKALVRQAFATAGTTVYTVPNGTTTAIVTNIVVTNTASSGATFTILLDGVEVFAETPIAGKATVSVDMKQVLDADSTPKSISGFASATTVNLHISGIEIS
jgi:hypothetical protein